MDGEEKLSWRKRIHYWLCDLFGVVSCDDFYALYKDMEKFVQAVDIFAKSQAEFNQLVAEKIGIRMKDDAETKMKNMLSEKDSMERMFG